MYHEIDKANAQLAVMNVWREQGGAAAVCFGPIRLEGRQPFLHEFLEGNERALTARLPLQQVVIQAASIQFKDGQHQC